MRHDPEMANGGNSPSGSGSALPGHGSPEALADTVSLASARTDLLPALLALSTITLLGIPLGWVWSRLAPPQLAAPGPDGALTALVMESYHDFDALGVFLLLGCATGLLTAVTLWMVRGHRGPLLLAAGALGSLLAALLALHMGNWFAELLYPVPGNPRGGQLIAMPPRIATQWATTMQPLAMALVYGLVASWNGSEDLDRG